MTTQDNTPEALKPEFEAIAATIRRVANQHQDDCLSLLALLRLLETLHREIRDSAFQDSLPNNRQALYNLLKDIEADGGWPYIQRMKLRSLLINWLEADTNAHGVMSNGETPKPIEQNSHS